MNGINCIMLKEFWEFKSLGKKIFIFLAITLYFPLMILCRSTNSFIPENICIILSPIVISFAISGQLGFDSILEEKKSKTLESLLSSNLSKLSIVIGKILLPSIIGFVFSLLSIIILKFGFLIIYNESVFNINIQMLVSPIISAYFGCVITMLVSLICPNGKIAPLISFIFMMLIIFFIYKLIISFSISYILIYILLISICCLLTFINAWILKNKTSLIFD